MTTATKYLQTAGSLTLGANGRTPKVVLEEEVELMLESLGWGNEAKVRYTGTTAYIRADDQGVELNAQVRRRTNGRLEVALIATVYFDAKRMPPDEIMAPTTLVEAVRNAGYRIRSCPAIPVDALNKL